MRLRFPIAVTLWFSLAASAHAETRSPYRTDLSVSGLTAALDESSHISTRSFSMRPSRERIQPVSVAAFIRGEGRITAQFSTKRNFSASGSFETKGRTIIDTVRPTFLQGGISLGGSDVNTPAALSVIENSLQFSFVGRARGSKGRQTLYTVRARVRNGVVENARVSRVRSTTFRPGACSASVEDIHGHRESKEAMLHSRAVSTSSEEGTTAAPPKVLTISTDADPEWHARFGNRSNAEIARILNTAEAIFLRDFGITFSIVKQHTYTDASPYTALAADQLLLQFAANQSNSVNLADTQEQYSQDVDIKHLFSGKDLNGQVLGIAYVGAACAAPQFAFGLSQTYMNDATVGVFAHELAHNLGAHHDLEGRGTIMYPSISLPPSSQFSQKSKEEISNFLDQHGGCLATDSTSGPGLPILDDAPSAPATQWRIKFRRAPSRTAARGVVFTGTLNASDAQSLAGFTVQLLVNDTAIRSTQTRASGSFRFSLPNSAFRRKSNVVYTKTEDGRALSQPIRIGAMRRR